MACIAGTDNAILKFGSSLLICPLGCIGISLTCVLGALSENRSALRKRWTFHGLFDERH